MKTGRPVFTPTAAHKRKVKELAAKGLSQRDAARMIPCALETFRKHFLDDFLVHSKKSEGVRTKKAEPAPKVKIDPAQRTRVERLVYCGMAEERVALVIGCTVEFLKEHFAPELAAGAAKTEADVVDLLFDSAKKGNVAAQKHLEVMGTLARADGGSDTRVGKKEQRAEAAKKAGTGKFAPPAPPKLAVDNTK